MSEKNTPSENTISSKENEMSDVLQAIKGLSENIALANSPQENEGGLGKWLFILLILAGLGYGGYWYSLQDNPQQSLAQVNSVFQEKKDLVSQKIQQFSTSEFSQQEIVFLKTLSQKTQKYESLLVEIKKENQSLSEKINLQDEKISALEAEIKIQSEENTKEKTSLIDFLESQLLFLKGEALDIKVPTEKNDSIVTDQDVLPEIKKTGEPQVTPEIPKEQAQPSSEEIKEAQTQPSAFEKLFQ